MKIKNNSFLDIFLYIFTFLVIYTPNIFLNSNINYIMPFVYLIISFLFLKRAKIKIDGIYKSIFLVVVVWIFSILFFMIRALIAGVEIFDIKGLRIVQQGSIIATILNICIIERHLTYKGYNTEQKMNFIFKVAMIQFAIVFLMILFPGFRISVLNYINAYEEWNKFLIEKRIYGIMFNYSYSTPIFHGILASIALTFGILYNKKYLYYIPFLIIMIVLNGRTGLLIFMLGALVNFIYFLLKKKYIKKLINSLFIFIIMFVLSLAFIKNYNEKTYKFLMSGIEDVYIYLVNGEKDGNIEVLSDSIKDGFNYRVLFFGAGYTTRAIPEYLSNKEGHSDVGYINEMYMGGIVYMLLLYLPMIYFILKDYNLNKLDIKSSTFNLIVKWTLILTIIISNIKGDVFRSGILMLIPFYLKLIIFDEGVNNEN